MTEEPFIYLKDVLRASLKTADPEGRDISNRLVMTVLGSLEVAESKLLAVQEVHARYFDVDLEPGEPDSTPSPEDVWRYDRDVRKAIRGG